VRKNKLTGVVPSELLERSKAGSLSLRYTQETHIIFKKKKYLQ